MRGGQVYQIPIGSCRFGIKIAREYDETEVTHNFVNSYHGTKQKFIKNIVNHGLQAPGAKLPTGEEIKVVDGHIKAETNDVFSSPSFLYSSSDVYAKVYKDEKSGKIYKFVLQLRQKPHSFTAQKQTLCKKDHSEDRFIEDGLLEYVTERKNIKSIVVIGVCIFELDPETNPSLPPELLNCKRFSIPREDEEQMRRAVQKLLKIHPNLFERVQKTIENSVKMTDMKVVLEQFVKEVKSFKMTKGPIKITSSAFGIIGCGLTLTPMAPFGAAIGVLSSVAGIGTNIVEYRKNKKFNRKIAELDEIMKEANELRSIMEIFYDQKNPIWDLEDVKPKSQSSIGEYVRAGGAISKLVFDTKNMELTKIVKELSSLTLSESQNFEKITRLASELASNKKEYEMMVNLVKTQEGSILMTQGANTLLTICEDTLQNAEKFISKFSKFEAGKFLEKTAPLSKGGHLKPKMPSRAAS